MVIVVASVPVIVNAHLLVGPNVSGVSMCIPIIVVVNRFRRSTVTQRPYNHRHPQLRHVVASMNWKHVNVVVILVVAVRIVRWVKIVGRSMRIRAVVDRL